MLKLNLVSIAFADLPADKLQHLMQNATGLPTNEILAELESERNTCEMTISKLTTISVDFIGDGYMTEKINKTRDEAAELSSACRQIISELKKFDTRKYQTNKLSKAYINELYKSVINKQAEKFARVNDDIAVEFENILNR